MKAEIEHGIRNAGEFTLNAIKRASGIEGYLQSRSASGKMYPEGRFGNIIYPPLVGLVQLAFPISFDGIYKAEVNPVVKNNTIRALTTFLDAGVTFGTIMYALNGEPAIAATGKTIYNAGAAVLSEAFNKNNKKSLINP